MMVGTGAGEKYKNSKNRGSIYVVCAACEEWRRRENGSFLKKAASGRTWDEVFSFYQILSEKIRREMADDPGQAVSGICVY
jgi:hypothetical protein